MYATLRWASPPSRAHAEADLSTAVDPGRRVLLADASSRRPTRSGAEGAPARAGVAGRPCLIVVALVLLCSAACARPARGTGPISGRSELRIADSGRAFAYPPAGRFTLVLSLHNHPPELLRVTCQPPAALARGPILPETDAPLWMARFEAVAPGRCDLVDNDFRATIEIAQPGSAGRPTGRDHMFG